MTRDFGGEGFKRQKFVIPDGVSLSQSSWEAWCEFVIPRKEVTRDLGGEGFKRPRFVTPDRTSLS